MTDSQAWFEQRKQHERERIIKLLTEQYGEDYVDLGVVGQVVRLIKADPC